LKTVAALQPSRYPRASKLLLNPAVMGRRAPRDRSSRSTVATSDVFSPTPAPREGQGQEVSGRVGGFTVRVGPRPAITSRSGGTISSKTPGLTNDHRSGPSSGILYTRRGGSFVFKSTVLRESRGPKHGPCVRLGLSQRFETRAWRGPHLKTRLSSSEFGLGHFTRSFPQASYTPS